MENLNGKYPLTPDGTQPLVIDLPASLVTALPVTASPVPPHTWSDVAYRTMDGGVAAFGFLWKLFKLLICLCLDGLDMVMVGWIGVSPLFEIGSAMICMALWGKRGLWGIAEVLEFSEFIDPWFPVCTLIALKAWND